MQLLWKNVTSLYVTCLQSSNGKKTIQLVVYQKSLFQYNIIWLTVLYIIAKTTFYHAHLKPQYTHYENTNSFFLIVFAVDVVAYSNLSQLLLSAYQVVEDVLYDQNRPSVEHIEIYDDNK